MLENEPGLQAPWNWRNRAKDALITIAAGAIVAALVWFLNAPDESLGASQPVNIVGVGSGPPPTVGQPAPDFSVPALDGSIIRLSDYRGRPVWINFWATWCPPCRAEAPEIEATYKEEKGKGLAILALSIGEDPKVVKEYVDKTGLTFTIGLDTTTAVAAQYRITGLPSHFFVDADGILRVIQVGGMNKAGMKSRLDKIM